MTADAMQTTNKKLAKEDGAVTNNMTRFHPRHIATHQPLPKITGKISVTHILLFVLAL